MGAEQAAETRRPTSAAGADWAGPGEAEEADKFSTPAP
jgi:hypothetical protein